MQWYYSKNGTQLGPVPFVELASKISSGEVLPTDLVWREGMTDWLPAGQVTEFSNPGTPPSPSGADQSVSPYTPPVSAPSDHAFGQQIPSYLWQSVVVTLFCCLPFGIVAIIYAAKVESLKSSGNVVAARAASSSARTWCWVSFGVGLAFVLFYLVSIMAASASGNLG